MVINFYILLTIFFQPIFFGLNKSLASQLGQPQCEVALIMHDIELNGEGIK